MLLKIAIENSKASHVWLLLPPLITKLVNHICCVFYCLCENSSSLHLHSFPFLISRRQSSCYRLGRFHQSEGCTEKLYPPLDDALTALLQEQTESCPLACSMTEICWDCSQNMAVGQQQQTISEYLDVANQVTWDGFHMWLSLIAISNSERDQGVLLHCKDSLDQGCPSQAKSK